MPVLCHKLIDICFRVKMRVVLFVALLCFGVLAVQAYEDSNLEDDDFAEFEQFDADDDLPGGDQGFQDKG